MKVQYFEDTDTLYVELSDSNIAQTKELNENLYIDLDAEGKIISRIKHDIRLKKAAGQ